MPTTAPAYTIGGITRPELHFDATGHILLEAVVVEFIALYGLKALFLGLPPGTPFQLVVPTLTVPTLTVPVDADVGANNVLEGAATGTLVGLTALATNTGGPAVTYSLTDNAGGRFQIDAATGVVTVANGALIDYDHGAREHTITVQATAGALSRTQTFTITLAAANDAPVAGNDALVATQDQAGVLAVNLLANDTDLDGPVPEVTSFALVTGGAGSASAPGTIVLANGAALSVDSAGHVTLAQNGAYDNLNAGETAQIVFNYQMTDGGTPAYAAGAQAVITVTGSNDQVDLDLNFGNAGDDRNAGLFDNVTPAQLVFGVAATEIADAEDKLSSVSITITAPQGGSTNAGEALGIAPDTLALVSSLLGFTVEVSGNGGQSLTISAPSGQFFTAQALETLLENVTYAINQSDFSFNASDRALSVTVTDFSTGATSDTALLTLDMRADVTATAGQNAFTGGNLSDLARGGAGDDVIAGGAGVDALVGGADNDTLTGGSGDDTIIGNDATVVRSGATFNVGGITGAAPNAGESDTAVYSGASTEYVVTHDPSGSYTVADQVAGRDGTDTLWGIETIDFAGGGGGARACHQGVRFLGERPARDLRCRSARSGGCIRERRGRRQHHRARCGRRIVLRRGLAGRHQ